MKKTEEEKKSIERENILSKMKDKLNYKKKRRNIGEWKIENKCKEKTNMTQRKQERK